MANRLPRILVGIPCMMKTDVVFEDSMRTALIGQGTYYIAEVNRAIGHITADGRNQIVKTALKYDFDYVFFMDSDMVFPPGCLAKMLRRVKEIPENELPVVSGVYNTRSDHRLNIYRWIPDKSTFESINHDVDPEFKLNSGKLYKTDCVGTGCMLLDCNIFREIDFPWFEYPYWVNDLNDSDKDNMRNHVIYKLLNDIKYFGDGNYHYKGFLFNGDAYKLDLDYSRIDELIELTKSKIKPLKLEWWSEDTYFCKRMYDRGIHVYVDTDIVCKHIMSTLVVQADDKEYQLERIDGVKY